MKIAVLCNGVVLQPALEALHSQGLLTGVAMPVSNGSADINLPLEAALLHAGVPFLRVDRTNPAGQLDPWLRKIDADAVCCMGFPCKVPAGLLELPRLGFFNFHGGALPRYRGPDPVFWQIRNREPSGAIVVHRMTPEFDCGGMAHAAQVPIGPDDTYGLHMQRLGAVLPRVTIEFVQQLAIHGDKLPLQAQDAAAARWLPRPTEADRSIDWFWPAVEIDALVRACNPTYGGAMTHVKGIPVRLLEVSPAPPCPDSAPPGTIVAADSSEGLRVACGQGETLLLELVWGMDGFFSGRRMAKIFGLRPGDLLS